MVSNVLPFALLPFRCAWLYITEREKNIIDLFIKIGYTDSWRKQVQAKNVSFIPDYIHENCWQSHVWRLEENWIVLLLPVILYTQTQINIIYANRLINATGIIVAVNLALANCEHYYVYVYMYQSISYSLSI